MTGLARRLIRCRRGSITLEAAIVVPVAVILVLSAWHLVMLMMVDADLEAAIRWATRFALTNEVPAGKTRDEAVRAIVEGYVGGWAAPATLKVEPKAYKSFSNIGQPEPFDDDDGDGQWDAGEDFTDVNKNGRWDDDMGRTGAGGSGDVVVYFISFDGGTGLAALSTAWLPVPHFERVMVVQNE